MPGDNFSNFVLMGIEAAGFYRWTGKFMERFFQHFLLVATVHDGKEPGKDIAQGQGCRTDIF